jgi:hypothetical protein
MRSYSFTTSKQKALRHRSTLESISKVGPSWLKPLHRVSRSETRKPHEPSGSSSSAVVATSLPVQLAITLTCSAPSISIDAFSLNAPSTESESPKNCERRVSPAGGILHTENSFALFGFFATLSRSMQRIIYLDPQAAKPAGGSLSVRITRSNSQILRDVASPDI